MTTSGVTGMITKHLILVEASGENFRAWIVDSEISEALNLDLRLLLLVCVDGLFIDSRMRPSVCAVTGWWILLYTWHPCSIRHSISSSTKADEHIIL